MCEKEENFTWLDYLDKFYDPITSLQEGPEVISSWNSSCESVTSTKVVVDRNMRFL